MPRSCPRSNQLKSAGHICFLRWHPERAHHRSPHWQELGTPAGTPHAGRATHRDRVVAGATTPSMFSFRNSHLRAQPRGARGEPRFSCGAFSTCRDHQIASTRIASRRPRSRLRWPEINGRKCFDWTDISDNRVFGETTKLRISSGSRGRLP
jgi:hypothetical protein